MDHADACGQGVEGGGEFHLLPVEEDAAAVAAGFPDDIHAEEDFHEGALARAVLAAQAQHLAGLQGKVDVCEDLVAEEVFFDVLHLQQGSAIICHIFTLPKRPGGDEPPPVV